MKQLIIATIFSGLVAGTAGCPGTTEVDEPLVGDWEGAELVAGSRNELAIDEGMRGTSVIYFYLDGSAYYAEFDVELRDEDGIHYQLDFECNGDCAVLDFTMECDLRGTDRLDCAGSDLFSDYDFQWEKR